MSLILEAMMASIFNKFSWHEMKRAFHTEDANQQAKWLHHGKELKESFVIFNAKYLGCVEVNQPKGVEVVRAAIKKLKIARQLKKSEAGHKGSKLIKVELVISIDSIKVIEVKTKNMICTRPLQRVSYCADDHKDKRLFAFIAKEQETKRHKCFVFVSEKEASEITLTLGQAFQLAYKRYLSSEKAELKSNKDSINIGKEIEKLKKENEKLKQELETNKLSPRDDLSSPRDNISSPRDDTLSPREDPSLGSHKLSPRAGPMSPPPMPQGPPPQLVDYDNSAMQPKTELPLQTLPMDSFGFLPDASFNSGGSSFKGSCDDLDLFNDFHPETSVAVNANSCQVKSPHLDFNANHNNNIDNIDMFGMFDGSPREEDFYVKNDPFADTPDWRSVASEETNMHQTLYNHSEPELSGVQSPNPFISSPRLVNSNLNQNETVANGVPHSEESSDLFSQYLSNVVAHRTSSQDSHDSIGDNSITANFGNDLSFNKLNLTDASGNVMSEFNETDDGFFTDSIGRSKAHSTGSIIKKNPSPYEGPPPLNNPIGPIRSNLTDSGMSLEVVNEGAIFQSVTPRQKAFSFDAATSSQPHPRLVKQQSQPSNLFSMNKSSLADSGSTISEVSESADESFNDSFSMQRPKAYSVNVATTPQIVRPRPSSFCAQSQMLPAPPTKSALKKPMATPKPVLQSTPVKAEPKKSPAEEKRLRHMLPNVGRSQTVSLDLKSRSRAAPLQPIRPLKESIRQASMSLEDLCSIDAPSSTKSSRSDSSTRNPFAAGQVP